MNRQSASALFSLLALVLLAVPSSAREPRTNLRLSPHEGLGHHPVGYQQSHVPNLAALEGGEIPLRYAILSEAKRDYTFVVVDDGLLRRHEMPNQRGDEIEAATPTLAVISDNHRAGPASEGESAAVTTPAPASFNVAPLVSYNTEDPPSHSRKYLESKK